MPRISVPATLAEASQALSVLNAPVGTIAVDASGDVQKRFDSGWFGIIEEPDGDHWLARGQEGIELPAIVLRWGL